jgi:hypothetical protein
MMWALSRSDAANPIIERRVAVVKCTVILAGRQNCGCLIAKDAGGPVIGEKEMYGTVWLDDLANGLEGNGRIQNKEVRVISARTWEDRRKAEHIQGVPEYGDIS